MKNSQVSALLFLWVLLFSTGKEVVATENGRSCSEGIKMAGPCKNPECSNLCKERHGDEAIGVCLGGCFCRYPCLSS
ncbi:hypothetical protein E1A91_D13G189600v1 [Gossypium mustelinum]|uniref:Knottin scorpion toxin-like domain-containing protein n=1 Tax=Gossypium mustelinum TaxID=34275 RepID=A0A5D2S5C6_GOSMU|nr:hypothetical protein E1A91_D13G189600v1 [Gossypium mustelinum]